MTQTIQFKPASDRGPVEAHNEQLDERPMEFWPEVASCFPSERPAPVNPANSFGRVLFEMFLVLAGAGALAVGISLFAPGSGLP